MHEYELEFSDGLKITGKDHNTLRLFHPNWINGNRSDYNLAQLMYVSGEYESLPLTIKRSEDHVDFLNGVFSISESALERETQTLISVKRRVVRQE